MLRRPPRSSRTDTLFPATTVSRSRSPFSTTSPPAGWKGSVQLALHVPANSGLGRLTCAAVATGAGTPGPKLTPPRDVTFRSEEHTSELQSLMRLSYAVFCLNQKKEELPFEPLQDMLLTYADS